MIKRTEILFGCGWFLVLAGLLGVLLVLGFFSIPFYAYYYEKEDLAADTGMTAEEAMVCHETLLDYLAGRREDITVSAEVYGQQQEVFSEQEALHMQDVRVLLHRAAAGTGLSLLTGVLLLLLPGRRSREGHRWRVAAGFHGGGAFFLSLLAVAGLLVFTDFDAFWRQVHEILFPHNTYWLMDPNTSVMINMYPEGYWFSVIGLSLVLVLGVMLGIEIFFCRRVHRQQENCSL